jgi:hypothetical protein
VRVHTPEGSWDGNLRLKRAIALRNFEHKAAFKVKWDRRLKMGRGLLLWLIGIPIPIILMIWLFGGLH